MKYFLDTEFIESGPYYSIALLSIGIVAEDGREFYAVNREADRNRASDWVKENVLPHLGDTTPQALATIGYMIQKFVGEDEPEFWGYYADYDWVVFCQIFGAMINLPKGWPMFCRDIKQAAMELGNPKLPTQESVEHNALSDARWNKLAYEFLMEKTTEFRIIGKDSGVALIADERLRQIKVEGWTPEHDDAHEDGELADAASCYAYVSNYEHPEGVRVPEDWPWDRKWWKPSANPIRNLVKAGALIAAEIDRLQRKKEK